MAAVIHSLWKKDDRNPLILPANIAIDDPRVQFELTRYLPTTGCRDRERRGRAPTRCRYGLTVRFRTSESSTLPDASRERFISDPHPPPMRHIGVLRTIASNSAVSCRGSLRRSSATRAAAGRCGNVPLPGWSALLVLHTANRHEAGGGSCRAVEARPRQGCAGARFATPIGSPRHG